MSLLRYSEYKDSGVEWLGEVPAHWKTKRLKHCLTLLTEKVGSCQNKVALENIESWSGQFLPSDTEFEGDGVAFEKHDILFGKLRPYLAKVYLADSSGEAVGDFHVLRSGAGVIPRYAQYQILSRDFIDLVDGSTFGSKMPRACWEFVGNMPFPLPSTSEQTAIATFLDRETATIDGLITEQEKLIALLAEKRQATISHAVTKGLNPAAPMKDSGGAWLGDVPAHWEVTQLKRLCILITDGAHVSPETEGGVYHFVSTKDLIADDIDFESSLLTSASSYEQLVKNGCRPLVGDVLFSKDGTIGRTVHVKFEMEFVVASSLIIIRPDSNLLRPSFLNCLCKSSVVSQ